MAGVWAHYISGFFIRAYKDRAKGSLLIPASGEDFETLLQYFVVQKAMTIFNGYLKKDPQRLVIPQTLLREILAGSAAEAVPVVPEKAVSADVATKVAPVDAATKAASADAVAKAAEEIVEPKPADIVAEKTVASVPIP